MATQRSLMTGYADGIVDKTSKDRYLEKLRLINGQDPYELSMKEWKDDTSLWPSITYIHVSMYLIFLPSPYTKEDMLNYKSLDSFQNFQSGWVREVLVKEINQKKLVIGKVSVAQ